MTKCDGEYCKITHSTCLFHLFIIWWVHCIVYNIKSSRTSTCSLSRCGKGSRTACSHARRSGGPGLPVHAQAVAVQGCSVAFAVPAHNSVNCPFAHFENHQVGDYGFLCWSHIHPLCVDWISGYVGARARSSRAIARLVFTHHPIMCASNASVMWNIKPNRVSTLSPGLWLVEMRSDKSAIRCNCGDMRHTFRWVSWDESKSLIGYRYRMTFVSHLSHLSPPSPCSG